jgi:hypothetical protein
MKMQFQTNSLRRFILTAMTCCGIAAVAASIMPQLVVYPTTAGEKPSEDFIVKVNGSLDRPLHLFANPLEKDAPKQDDPNVVYFGPGVHDPGPIQIKNNQTLYLAGGAIVRPRIPPDEKPTVEKDWSGCKCYRNLIEADGVTIVTNRGRGIVSVITSSRMPSLKWNGGRQQNPAGRCVCFQVAGWPWPD